MNPVEIEEAISLLAEQPFSRVDFVWQFLEAFGNKKTTITKLKNGANNKSDVEGAVLLRNDIHLATCDVGKVDLVLQQLINSHATLKFKAKYVLATDGEYLQAQRVDAEGKIACDYKDFADHFGFFLPLAGITTTQRIEENPIDVRATSRLNRLYIELLKTNGEWATGTKRQDMNKFMARLIFCFFAEDTDIFHGDNLFTATIQQWSNSNSDNTHEIIGELFRAMNTKWEERTGEKIKSFANGFPYVNGDLFSGSLEVPKFSRSARAHLLHVGELDWQRINPDIFGSMIQAIEDEEERGNLGMHYTSVPNIKRVLDPLFLNDLRAKLEEAKNNPRKLLNLKNRMAKIRVFDPACGSGNFLVIAYKEMREIENEINIRRGETHLPSALTISNFRGIEFNNFPAQVARLALIIAEFQCDVLYMGQKSALSEFLPLDSKNWITCGNALQLDWLELCPPTGTSVKLVEEDLYQTPLNQAEVDFENEGGETYICGNPPYLGKRLQKPEHKIDMTSVFGKHTKTYKSLDYVTGWFMKAAEYGTYTNATSAFVATNSVCQGQHVPTLWPLINKTGHEIVFAHTSFEWSNLAKYNAGVTVVIVGISNNKKKMKYLYSISDDGQTIKKDAVNINAYLIPTSNIIVKNNAKPICEQSEMLRGNMAGDGGHLLFSSSEEVSNLGLPSDDKKLFIRTFLGSSEFIHGVMRYCLWIEDKHLAKAKSIQAIKSRLEKIKSERLKSPRKQTQETAQTPHKFLEVRYKQNNGIIVVPGISSSNRKYLPVGLVNAKTIVGVASFTIYDAPLWNLALIASRIHLVWISTVCGTLRTDFSYSNTLGWNTFPIPKLTEKNKADLTRCAEEILLAREAHFPATIADLYKPDAMPANLRYAHEQNDEVVERIYIGRKFKNDTERLEKLFALYEKMTKNKGTT